MRTKPARKWNSQQEHNSFGIVNWFKSKGIKNQEIIKEVMYNFCLNQGFEGLSNKTQEKTIVNFCGNRFQKFAPFAILFMKENNYLIKSTPSPTKQ